MSFPSRFSAGSFPQGSPGPDYFSATSPSPSPNPGGPGAGNLSARSVGSEGRRTFDRDKAIEKFRSRQCIFFLSPDGCPYGSACLFAHGVGDRREVSNGTAPGVDVYCNALYKTKRCLHWGKSLAATGVPFCPHSFRCTFAHGTLRLALLSLPHCLCPFLPLFRHLPSLPCFLSLSLLVVCGSAGPEELSRFVAISEGRLPKECCEPGVYIRMVSEGTIAPLPTFYLLAHGGPASQEAFLASQSGAAHTVVTSAAQSAAAHTLQALQQQAQAQAQASSSSGLLGVGPGLSGSGTMMTSPGGPGIAGAGAFATPPRHQLQNSRPPLGSLPSSAYSPGGPGLGTGGRIGTTSTSSDLPAKGATTAATTAATSPGFAFSAFAGGAGSSQQPLQPAQPQQQQSTHQLNEQQQQLLQQLSLLLQQQQSGVGSGSGSSAASASSPSLEQLSALLAATNVGGGGSSMNSPPVLRTTTSQPSSSSSSPLRQPTILSSQSMWLGAGGGAGEASPILMPAATPGLSDQEDMRPNIFQTLLMTTAGSSNLEASASVPPSEAAVGGGDTTSAPAVPHLSAVLAPGGTSAALQFDQATARQMGLGFSTIDAATLRMQPPRPGSLSLSGRRGSLPGGSVSAATTIAATASNNFSAYGLPSAAASVSGPSEAPYSNITDEQYRALIRPYIRADDGTVDTSRMPPSLLAVHLNKCVGNAQREAIANGIDPNAAARAAQRVIEHVQRGGSIDSLGGALQQQQQTMASAASTKQLSAAALEYNPGATTGTNINHLLPRRPIPSPIRAGGGSHTRGQEEEDESADPTVNHNADSTRAQPSVATDGAGTTSGSVFASSSFVFGRATGHTTTSAVASSGAVVAGVGEEALNPQQEEELVGGAGIVAGGAGGGLLLSGPGQSIGGDNDDDDDPALQTALAAITRALGGGNGNGNGNGSGVSSSQNQHQRQLQSSQSSQSGEVEVEAGSVGSHEAEGDLVIRRRLSQDLACLGFVSTDSSLEGGGDNINSHGNNNIMMHPRSGVSANGTASLAMPPLLGGGSLGVGGGGSPHLHGLQPQPQQQQPQQHSQHAAQLLAQQKVWLHMQQHQQQQQQQGQQGGGGGQHGHGQGQGSPLIRGLTSAGGSITRAGGDSPLLLSLSSSSSSSVSSTAASVGDSFSLPGSRTPVPPSSPPLFASQLSAGSASAFGQEQQQQQQQSPPFGAAPSFASTLPSPSIPSPFLTSSQYPLQQGGHSGHGQQQLPSALLSFDSRPSVSSASFFGPSALSGGQQRRGDSSNTSTAAPSTTTIPALPPLDLGPVFSGQLSNSSSFQSMSNSSSGSNGSSESFAVAGTGVGTRQPQQPQQQLSSSLSASEVAMLLMQQENESRMRQQQLITSLMSRLSPEEQVKFISMPLSQHHSQAQGQPQQPLSAVFASPSSALMSPFALEPLPQPRPQPVAGVPALAGAGAGAGLGGVLATGRTLTSTVASTTATNYSIDSNISGHNPSGNSDGNGTLGNPNFTTTQLPQSHPQTQPQPSPPSELTLMAAARIASPPAPKQQQQQQQQYQSGEEREDGNGHGDGEGHGDEGEGQEKAV
jgi:hypothetical protein